MTKSPSNSVIRLKKGDANGILVWHLTRIARNSLDGGRIIYLMDQGFIQEIKTKEKTYQNTTSDKFMMQIEFAMSKKNSDDTSDFVKRDISSKLEKGEFPGTAPSGYLNISQEGVISGKRYDQKKQELLLQRNRPLKRIEIDPILGPVYRRLFKKALTGAYSLEQLREEAFRLGIKAKGSGKVISKSVIQALISNPFYAGEFNYAGRRWVGVHDGIITMKEYEQIQQTLKTRSRPKFKKRQYALSMLIECDTCGRLLTGDYQKGHYYYRCSHALGRQALCSNTSYYREDQLEEEILKTLNLIQIPSDVLEWGLKYLEVAYKEELKTYTSIRQKHQKDYEGIKSKLERLTFKYLSADNSNGELISDEEYKQLKRSIQKEILSVEKALDFNKINENNWLKKCEEFFNQLREFQSSYKNASVQDKREILNEIGSRFSIKDQILALELKKPFSYIVEANRKKRVTRTVKKSKNIGKSPISCPISTVWQDCMDFIRTYFQNQEEPHFLNSVGFI